MEVNASINLHFSLEKTRLVTSISVANYGWIAFIKSKNRLNYSTHSFSFSMERLQIPLLKPIDFLLFLNSSFLSSGVIY